MKLTIILLTITILHVSAASFAQKITLNKQNVKLEDVFNDIRRQTGYDFFYNLKLIKKARPVSLQVKNADIDDVLKACFENQPFTYVIKEHAVVIKQRQEITELLQPVLEQLISVFGRVLDENGKPLSGASVKIKGTNLGVITGADGTFKLNDLDENAVIIISFLGYASAEVKADPKAEMKVSLNPVSSALQEVKVVVGYGSAISSRDVVGSLSTVGSKDMQDRPAANGFDALQGRVSGLNILSSSGEPTAIPSLYLHGTGSINSGNTPLIVLDGAPVDPRTILALNPNDYSSVTVLKDAAATSIYGSRAANGVIYITTKMGALNKPASISVTSQYGVSQLANTDYFKNFMNTATLSKFLVDFGTQTQESMDAVLAKYNADTKWYKVYYKNNTPTTQNNFSVSGGGGTTTYFISGGYYKQEGLAWGSLYNRYTLRSNIATEATKWMKIGVNLYGSYDVRQANFFSGASLDGGLAVLLSPWYPSTDANGKTYDVVPGTYRDHPKYFASKFPSHINNTGFNPTAYIAITPIKGLTLKTQAAMDDYDFRSTGYQSPSYISSPNNGFVSESFIRGVSKTFTNTGEYKFSVNDDNHFTALLGQEYTDGQTMNFLASSSGQTDDRLLLLNAGTINKNVNSGNTEYSYYSLFARGDYDWKRKYFLEASVRQDKSSRFGANHKSAVFYSVGGSWRAKQESFLKDVSWLSDLTLRASTGTSGNSSIGNYTSLATVGTTVYNQINGFSLAGAGYPNLTWEKQQLHNVGITASFFNRIFLETSYYIRTTTSMLLNVPYAFTTGISNQLENTGGLRNKGLDLDLSFDLIDRNNSHHAYITPRVIANFNSSEIVSLFQDKKYFVSGFNIWAVGQPITYQMPVWAGVNPANGLPSWYNADANPDKIVTKTTSNGTTNTFSSSLNQNTNLPVTPKGNGSLGLSAGYEGFSLDVLFNYVQGKYLFNLDQYYVQNPSVFLNYNQQNNVLNYWKQPGDVTPFPKKGEQFTQFDSRLIQDASFMRLKDLTIGYSVPKSILDKTHVFKSISIFFTGRNLITFTKYKGIDPEDNVSLAVGNNPNTRQYLGGIKLGF